MKEQVERIISELAAKHSDRRLDRFALTVESAGEEIRLAGRVLTAKNLEDAKRAIAGEFSGVNIETSGVKVMMPGKACAVATTLTDLHVEPSFLSEMFTQITNGQPLQILDEHEEGKWVLARQMDGYIGWAYKQYLTPTAAPVATHVVSAPVTGVFAEPNMPGSAFPLTRLAPGTMVRVVAERDAYARVELAGDGIRTGWVAAGRLRKLMGLKLPSNEMRTRMVTDARALTGVYYLWGGCTPFGIDCSGLAQLVHKINGVTLPRDADMQFKGGKAVEAPFNPGDLIFFHSEKSKEKISHVGMSLGGWNMIHSSRSRNGVYVENVQDNPNLKATFVGGGLICREFTTEVTEGHGEER